MCGIVGYIGEREASPLLIEGLKRLEYRGYDSCGIAILNNGTPRVTRAAGRIDRLEEKLRGLAEPAGEVQCGIGHTRWATHGSPVEINAHPHVDCTGHFLVAHNGIIENYMELKRELSARGHVFRSATDSEVMAHLIESHFTGSLEEAVRAAVLEVEGVYGLVAISTHDNKKIVATRNGPPLVLGYGEGENFIASDAPALLPHTRQLLFLNDREVAVIRRDSIELRDADGKRLSRQPELISWNAEMAEKEGYPHFMLKEIFEQPRAVRDTLRGRVDERGVVSLDEELGDAKKLAAVERVKIVACGTSLHAGLVGKFLIEELARLPVEVDYASEFRYRNPLLDEKTLVLGISQSGETADTLAALREGREHGATLLSICNVVGSMAARQSDCVLYTHAGPEIGVASTKAFTTQLAALGALALHLGGLRGVLPEDQACRFARELRRLPDLLEQVLRRDDEIRAMAARLCSYRNFLYLGRGVHYPIAMEGALKLKEISYIHAEGYPAGEMKHGPIALIDTEMPVVVLVPRDSVYRKTMSNIEEVKVRGGIVLAVAGEGDTDIVEKADYVIHVPESYPLLNPLLAVVPLQLLAYHIAVMRGCDVDKPRNLAKSVTVE